MRHIYYNKIDWWVWGVFLFTLAIIIAAGIGMPWYIPALWGMGTLGFLGGCMLGCWYVIDGDLLLVYMFFRPMRLPIKKIRDIRYCSGFIAGPAMSTRRLSIRFIDRSVLKSSMPIEISPKHRDEFVAHLLEINPEIAVIHK